jgi:predicted nucleic acid-binding Zn ribbon protein
MSGARFFARKAEPVRPILQRALAKNGVARRLPRRIAPETWAAAVGEQIAARAQPTVLAHGTLHVLVEDHRWRDQLDAARNLLIERINARLGAPLVRVLQFGLAHSGALDAARTRAGLAPERPTPPIDPGRVLGGARLDGALREALLRVAEARARKASA